MPRRTLRGDSFRVPLTDQGREREFGERASPGPPPTATPATAVHWPPTSRQCARTSRPRRHNPPSSRQPFPPRPVGGPRSGSKGGGPRAARTGGHGAEGAARRPWRVENESAANPRSTRGGIANMNYSISNNAEYGEYVTGPKIVTDATKEAMRQAPRDIQSGEYAKSFILENRAGAPTLQSRRRLTSDHQIEQVGEKLRAMMPWIKANRLVDKSRN